MGSTFSDLTVDEIIYMIGSPLSGTGNGMIPDFIIKCVVLPLFITFLFYLILKKIKSEKGKKTFRITSIFLSIIIIITSLFSFSIKANVPLYIKGRQRESKFIEDNFVDPASVRIDFKNEKKNLIFIYLESMEITFSDKENGGLFDENRIERLTRLSKENVCFNGNKDVLNGGYSMPGTTWTMGAIFGSSSGLPIKVNIGENQMNISEHFFPDIITLGDILEKEGYKNYFVAGSDAEFGGRKTFFKEHGDYIIKDINSAREEGFIAPDYNEFWGMEDEKLFSYAKEIIKSAKESGSPFNVTLLTVDTHFPGYKGEDFISYFPKDDYGSVLKLSSNRVYDFVSWIKEQPVFLDTVIVITGDHPTMEEGYINSDDDYIRKTYLCIINPAKEEKKGEYRDFTTFDLFPTVLSAMGADIEGNRLSLGTDLFSGEETLSEKYGFKYEADEINKRSVFLESLEAVSEEIKKIEDAFKDVKILKEKRKTINDKEKIDIEIEIEKKPYEISLIEAEIYENNGGIYDKEIFRMDEKEDGIFKLSIDTERFTGDKELYYNILLTTPYDKEKEKYITVKILSGGKLKE